MPRMIAVAHPGNVAPVPIVSLSNANPAILKLGAVDFGKFLVGQTVRFAGTGTAIDNTTTALSALGPGSNEFQLAGLDLSLEPAPITTGTVTKV